MRAIDRASGRLKSRERRLLRVMKDDGERRPHIKERCCRLLRHAKLERAELLGEEEC